MFDINKSFHFFIDKVCIKSKYGNQDLDHYKVIAGNELLLNYPEYFLQDFEKLYQYYESKFSSSLMEPLLNPNVENEIFDHNSFSKVSIGFKVRTHRNNSSVCDFETRNGEKLFHQIKKTKVTKLMHVLKSYKLLLGQAILEKGNFSETEIHFFEDALMKIEKGEVSLSFIKDGQKEQNSLGHFIKQYGTKDFYVEHNFYFPDVSHELIRKILHSYEASLAIKNFIYQFSFENEKELKAFQEQISECLIEKLDKIIEENHNVKKLEKRK